VPSIALDAASLLPAVYALGGAVIGGLITLKVSNDSFKHQLALEERRYQQRLEMEEAQRNRDAAALKRRLLRSLEGLHNTSRMSPKSRVNLSSWTKAAATLSTLLEDPQVDALLADPEYDALWTAAGEGRAVTTIIRMVADTACRGVALHPNPVQASIELFMEKLRAAFDALSQFDRSKEVSKSLARGFAACGIFLDNDAVFYPLPADGKTFIIRF
jgi:hypothetical protein